ncbi:MAG: YbaY family lipoprotein [Lysobacterales bacterium]
MRNAAILVFTMAAVGACASAPKQEAMPETMPGKHRPAPEAALLRGRAFYLERIAMSPGATLEVQLIGARGAAAPVTIATRTFSDLHGPPYDFTLSYAPARVSADMHCSLRAALRDREGHLEFATAAGAPVTPGSDARVEFRLVRAIDR